MLPSFDALPKTPRSRSAMQVCATTSAARTVAPASRKTAPQSASVAPVVTTSSTRTIRRPASGTPGRQRKRPPALSRSRRVRPCCASPPRR
ncbi:MAG: hypothetical protein WAN59_02670, partial [Candidatus Baltobacteraceae bacterium]